MILFDSDWNPANDAQAMARVWRPGQKKKVYLYRLLCTGTMEEKKFQRQISKLSLADSVVGGNVDANPQFDARELSRLFKYRDDTICDTHDLLNCRCSKNAKRIPQHLRNAVKMDELDTWDHYEDVASAHKYPILQAAGTADVSFAFVKETDPAKEPETDVVQEVELQFEQEEEKDENGKTTSSDDEEDE